MQPCTELKNIVLQHYGKFHSGEQSHSIEGTYSRQEGVVIISNDPKDREAWKRRMIYYLLCKIG